MCIRPHSTGFNKKGFKRKGGGLEETCHACQNIVRSSPGAYGDWQAPAAFQSWSFRTALKTPRAGTLPILWPPAIQVLEIQSFGRDLKKLFPLREQSRTAVSPSNHILCFLAPTKTFWLVVFCEVPLLRYATVAFNHWPLSQVMVHFIHLVWDQVQWACTLLSALILLSQSPSWLLNKILWC